MKKILYIISTIVCFNTSRGDVLVEKNFPKEYFVADSIFKKDSIGLVVKRGKNKEFHFFQISRINLEVKEIELDNFKKLFDINNEQIKNYEQKLLLDKANAKKKLETKVNYILSDCTKKQENEKEYLSWEDFCKSASFKIDSKNIIFNKDKFYPWEKFVDPVLWKNMLLFRIHIPENYGGDGEQCQAPSVNGFIALDVEMKRRLPVLTPETKFFSMIYMFHGTHVSLLKNDIFDNFVWIGNQYGFYALDEKLEEKISCYFKISGKDSLSFLKCSVADYVEDRKEYQASLLWKKEVALKKGSLPPEDSSKKMRLHAQFMLKIRESGLSKAQQDIAIKKGFEEIDSEMNKVLEATLKKEK